MTGQTIGSEAESKGFTPEVKKRDFSGSKAFLSGGFGGICLVLVGHPLDLIKVRMQTSAMGEFKSTLQCFLSIIRAGGLKGIYRGVSPPLLSVVPMMATSFWGYHISQNLCRFFWSLDKKEKLNDFQNTLAGGLSAIPTVILATPGERVKCIMQVSGDKLPRPTMVQVARDVFRSGGIQSLYRGFNITLIRDIPGSMAYFATYEILKDAFAKHQMPSFYSTLFAGGFAGVTNWLVAIPADVLKSRIQTSPNNLRIPQAYQHLVKAEGHAGLYRGLGPALLRAFPANAACFYGVEASRKFLDILF
ncbi:carnitine transporter [Entomophthora muscae]|uniref:Carnitine transporter n=1 Tax=Entomophthora muscae TaxID=34485 RepID=A0ACC2RL01_9FUNG|nr:carnitine transporter [Entomophthora muscae]